MRMTGLLMLCACTVLRASASAMTPSASPRLLRPERYELDLVVDFEAETIGGTARIRLVNPAEERVEAASFLLYRLMSVSEVRDESGRQRPFTQRIVSFEDEPKRQVNHVVVPLPRPLGIGERETLILTYRGHLLGYAETGSLYIQDRVDPAFTLIREDAEAYPTVRYPSFEVNRAAGLPTFDYLARIDVPESHVVANGGELVERTVNGQGRATYVYRNLKPAWRMDFAIAPFRTLERGKIRVFYLPEEAEGAERALRAMERCLDLFSGWFGSLKGASSFTVIEIPEGWGSQADVTSILQTAAAFRDPKRMGELYHEISHLWNPDSSDKPSPRWNEGLARFLEKLAAERLDSQPRVEESVESVAARLRERLGTEERLRRIPLRDYGREEMTDHAYSVGMLLFYVLHQAAGEEAFNKAIGNYYRHYSETGATTEDFVREVKDVSSIAVDRLFEDWLYTTRWSDLLLDGRPMRALAADYGR